MMRSRQTREAVTITAVRRGTGLLARLAFGVLGFGALVAMAGAQLTLPVYTADFNHDGILDTLVLSTTSPTATISLGSVPYGTFSATRGVTFPSACTNGFQPGVNYAPIVIADLNGDGIPDIAFDCIGSASQYIGTMLGNGDGTFAPATQLPGTSGTVDSFLAADFNQDGKMDLVAIGETFLNNTNVYQIKFYAGDGTGHFAQPVSTTIGDTGGSQYPAYSAVKPDLNGDGFPDLVLLSGDALTSTGDGPPSVTISVFGNNQNGTFGILSGSTSSPNTTAVLGSFNPDIAPYVFPSAILQASVFSPAAKDLVVPDRGVAPGIFTLKNTSTATTYSLGAPVKTAFAGLTDAQVGKVSGTAFDDVVVTDGTTFSVLANDGSGNYTASYPALIAPNTGSIFAVADANFDGYADIYTASTNATGGLNLNVNLVSGSATATSAPVALGIGSKAISATWTGNVNLLGSTATGSQVVNGTPSVAVVSSNSNPSVFGSPVTLTALVSPLTASTLIPSGLLTLKDNGTTLTSGTLDTTGKLTFTTSALTVGSHAITATYAGDTLFAGTISSALTQVVNGVPSMAVISSSSNPSVAGSPVTLTALVAPLTTNTLIPSGLLTLKDNGATLTSGSLDSTGKLSFTTSALTVGSHAITATYAGDSSFAGTISPALTQVVKNRTVAATLTWTPAVPSIVYGTALGAQQLNAVATGTNGVPLDGTFTYTPAAGAILHAGTQRLSVAFVPSDTNYLPATATTTITVTQAAPLLTWPIPASIAYGVPLGAAQLNATVNGVTSAALPGVFTYTPPAGTVLTPGTQTLNVSFVPTDAVDYTNAGGSVKLVVTGLTSTSVSPSTVTAGSGNTTITITGAGFVATSVVKVNGVDVATTLVSPTTLTAVIPAADFVKEGTLQITVFDPTLGITSQVLSITVTPVSPTVTLGGPTSTPPGSQPVLTFTVTPYPFPLTATLTLGFASSVTPAVNDPAVQFANGGRTLTFTIPANSTTVPPIRVQSGTVAGTITVPLVLTANGVNVTPTTVAPVVIVIPAAVPTVSSASMTQSGDQLTVVIHGFSNTREVTQAKFHFVGLSGAELDTPDVTIPATTLFGGWFGSAESDQYGSTFTYTQVFNVSDGAANIQSVDVTLTNTVGDSLMMTTQ